MAETSGPDKYAPPGRRSSEKAVDINQVEGDIREFVRRDVSILRQRRDDAEAIGNQAAGNLNAQVQRIAGASLDEIDRVISELESVRTMLRGEGERVSREIASYASLSHAASTAMKVIAESVRQWKGAQD
jgi:hypothetical protein